MENKTYGLHPLIRTIGIILIIVQLLSFIGVLRMDVGIYPDYEDFPHRYPTSVTKSNLTADMFFFAFEAGSDRFGSGFEDLTWSKDEYRVSTAQQMASAHFRESLGCRTGGSAGLIIYDTIITVSYWFCGIIGITLIVISKIINNKHTSYKNVPNLDNTDIPMYQNKDNSQKSASDNILEINENNTQYADIQHTITQNNVPKKPCENSDLSEKLSYALKFQTDEGMIRYLQTIDNEVVTGILKKPKDTIRKDIQTILDII